MRRKYVNIIGIGRVFAVMRGREWERWEFSYHKCVPLARTMWAGLSPEMRSYLELSGPFYKFMPVYGK
jgi:hypothetical protein